jgi:O-antigen/teichoic acid export membrane protein
MSTVQRVAKNTTVLLVAQVVSYLLAFLYTMYIARYLGAAGFGILSFALAFTGIFGVFGDLGLQPLTTREVARNKSLAPKYLANVSLMKVILAAVTFGLIALAINLMGYPTETIRVVYLFGLYVICAAFTQMFYSLFQAFERMEFQAIGQMLNAALLLGGVIFAIKLGFSIIGFASLYVITSAIALGYSFAVMKLKFSNPASASTAKVIELDWSFWKPTIKEALPFGLSAIFVAIFYWIGSVMLSSMKGDEVVGWYSAAYRMVLTLLFLPSAFNSAIFPVMSGFHVSSQDALRLSYAKYLKYMLVLTVPIGVGTTLLANRIILLIFGNGYMPSVVALQILVWAFVFISMSSPFYRLLEATNNQRKGTKAAAICMASNIALNLLLIPRYSYEGASIAAVATEGVSLAISFWYCNKLGYSMPRKLIGAAIKVVVATLAMAASVIVFHMLILPWLILASAAVYFALLLAIGGIDKEDRALFRTMLDSNKRDST